MRPKIVDVAMRRLLTNIKRNGVPYESAGHPAADAPYKHDIGQALQREWIEATDKSRFKLTEAGDIALRGMM